VEIDGIEVVEESDLPPARKFPWLLDVFLFPISAPAITIIGIYMFVPAVLYLIESGIGFVFDRLYISMMLVLATAAIDLVVTAYIFQYFSKCINDSTLGQIRAPETINCITEGTFEMVMGMLYIASCLLICLGPSLTYYSITNRSDWICWLLLACGAFFLPMVLLAVVMFDSLSALNPVLILSSIFSTFYTYCQTLLAFCVPVGIAVVVSICLPKDTVGVVGYLLRGGDTILTFTTGLPISRPEYTIGIISFLLRGVYAYLALMAAHILGRFYWKYQEKLNWEV